MKPLLVGESNPYGRNPRHALYPEPPNSAGDRLCRVIMGLSAREYLRRFDRVNLCFGRWADGVAKSAAVQILSSSFGKRDAAVVLLGARVSRAFSLTFRPFDVILPEAGIYGFPIVTLPHPSGRNLMWNAGDAVERARASLRIAGIEL